MKLQQNKSFLIGNTLVSGFIGILVGGIIGLNSHFGETVQLSIFFGFLYGSIVISFLLLGVVSVIILDSAIFYICNTAKNFSLWYLVIMVETLFVSMTITAFFTMTGLAI